MIHPCVFERNMNSVTALRAFESLSTHFVNHYFSINYFAKSTFDARATKSKTKPSGSSNKLKIGPFSVRTLQDGKKQEMSECISRLKSSKPLVFKVRKGGAVAEWVKVQNLSEI